MEESNRTFLIILYDRACVLAKTMTFTFHILGSLVTMQHWTEKQQGFAAIVYGNLDSVVLHIASTFSRVLIAHVPTNSSCY